MLGSLSASLLTAQAYDVLCDSSAVFKGVTQNIYVIVCVVTNILSCRASHVSKRERERERERWKTREGTSPCICTNPPELQFIFWFSRPFLLIIRPLEPTAVANSP